MGYDPVTHTRDGEYLPLLDMQPQPRWVLRVALAKQHGLKADAAAPGYPPPLYGEWQQTPWLLRKLGKPSWRRRCWEGWIPEPMEWDYDDGTRILAR